MSAPLKLCVCGSPIRDGDYPIVLSYKGLDGNPVHWDGTVCAHCFDAASNVRFRIAHATKDWGTCAYCGHEICRCDHKDCESILPPPTSATK